MLANLKPVAEALEARQKSSASWNLHLDKLSFERGRESGAKSRALQAVCRSYTNARTHLAKACNRRLVLVEALRARPGLAYREVRLVNIARLLLHLGRASVWENVGLYCERTTGLPLIPGTAVKGILSSWTCWEANLLPTGALPPIIVKTDQDRAQFPNKFVKRILGSNTEGGSTGAGEVICLGGWPVSPPKLALDILTPHEQRSPLPNPFLALDPDTIWIFPLLARPGADDSEKLLETAKDWLEDALTQVGLGAKTAAGYGRFRRLTEEDTVKLEKARNEALTGERQARESARASHADSARKEPKDAAKAAEEQGKAARRAILSPEDRAYEEFVEKIGDGTAAARDIASKSDSEKRQILRYFRSQEGTVVLKTWRNDKGKKRIQNLKDAGL